MLLVMWPSFPRRAKFLYGLMRRILSRDQFLLVTRVTEVTQKDGRNRIDVYIDNRSDQGQEVMTLLKEELPASWLIREHVPFHVRRATGSEGSAGIRENVGPETLNLATWNVQSFQPKKNPILWMSQRENVSVLALQETRCWLHRWAPKLSGFTVFSVPAENIRGRVGLALAFRRELQPVLVDQSPHWILCKIRVGTVWLFIANLYFPSGTGGDPVIRSLRRKLESIASDIREGQLILMGDFNRGMSEVDQIAWRFPVPLSRAGIRGHPGTFHGFRGGFDPTPIDHILIGSVPSHIPVARILRRWSDSDHWPMVVQVRLEGSAPSRPAHKRLLVRQATTETRDRFLSDNRWEVLANSINIDSDPAEAAEKVVSSFQDVGKDIGLIQSVASDTQPRRCMTNSCKRALMVRSEKLRTFLRTGTESDRDAFVEARKQARIEYRLSSKASWMRQLEELRHFTGTLDSKKAWGWMKRFIKPKMTVTNGMPAIVDAEGILRTDEAGKQQAWVEYYRKLFADPTGHSGDALWWQQFAPPTRPDQEPIDLLSGDDWFEPILAVLSELTNGKACGLDGIPPEWFKWLPRAPETVEDYVPPENSQNYAYQAVAKALILVCQQTTIPASWQTAEIVSILKTGDPTKPENYRGIALIPVGLKILCSVLIKGFNKALRERNILIQEQGGFRSREECVAQTASLLDICTKRRTRGQDTYLAFIDFKKAYDMVPHEALFAKLQWAGFCGTFIDFLRALYQSSKMAPRGTSTAVPVERGLRQGCPMSPSLFNFFINDIFEEIEGFKPPGVRVPSDSIEELRCRGLLFADDVLLFAESAEDLKASLAHVERWAQRWGMECGVRKCAVMLVSTTSSVDPVAFMTDLGPWRLHNQDVPIVNQYRYLGYEFTSDLEPTVHMATRREGAVKAFGACLPFLANRSIPLHNRALAYKVMVLPILTWGSELMPANKELLGPMAAVQHQQLRVLVGLRASSTLGCPLAMGRELDIAPFYVRVVTSRLRLFIKASTLRTWLRILCESPCRLPSRGKRPWTYLSRSLLQKKESVPRDMEIPFGVWLKEYEWKKLIETGQVSRSLVIYNERGYENGRGYLRFTAYNLSQSAGQLLLFKMRTGSFLSALRLAQMGYIPPRYFGECPFCHLPEPEDIEHLLLRCEFFAAQRVSFFYPLSSLNLDQTMFASALLGGELVGDEGVAGPVYFRQEPLTLVTIDYLQSIYEPRQHALRALLNGWPPRANAQLGTVVLSQGTELAVPGGSPPQGVLVGRNPTYLELGSDL